MKTFSENLATPVKTIYNKITKTALFPTQWKIEFQIPLPKVFPPENEDQLRNISKTPFFSKVYESFVGGWLLPIIQPYLDPGQCGLKGLSITHYLIKLLHFVHSTLDLKQPYAVLAACIDLSKAFNRVDHTLVIQDLYDMHTPPWLLRILISYLSNRSMFLSYNGAQSSQMSLPGGGPQGAYLGGIIFIIKYNGAFLRPPIPRPIIGPISKSKVEKVKFVDDGTVAVSLDLKACLIPDPVERPRPFNKHERTQHILPGQNNLLQSYIKDAESFVAQNKLVINTKKTSVMIFNKSRKWDFPPEVFFSNGTQIEYVSETKLVGLVISEDLSWEKNTLYICQKARQKLWMLRRMGKLPFTIHQMFDFYTKEIRSIVELAVPVWHPGLTGKQTNDIERIQKLAMKVILQDSYTNYPTACEMFMTQTLKLRREKLCLTFGRKNIKSENSLFMRINTNSQTRSSNVVREYKCNTSRFQKTSLPYMAKLLNANNKRK